MIRGPTVACFQVAPGRITPLRQRLNPTTRSGTGREVCVAPSPANRLERGALHLADREGHPLLTDYQPAGYSRGAPGLLGFASGWAPFVFTGRVKILSFVKATRVCASGPAKQMPVTAPPGTGTMQLTRPAWSQDPEQFASAGIDPATQDLVVAKSGFHFHLSFARIGDCVSVETPGLSGTASDAGVFPFQRRPTLWPDDPGLVPDLAARLFS